MFEVDTAYHYRVEMLERIADKLTEISPEDSRDLLLCAASLVHLVTYPVEELQAMLDAIEADSQEEANTKAVEAMLRLYN